jgi:hypothetical protein
VSPNYWQVIITQTEEFSLPVDSYGGSGYDGADVRTYTLPLATGPWYVHMRAYWWDGVNPGSTVEYLITNKVLIYGDYPAPTPTPTPTPNLSVSGEVLRLNADSLDQSHGQNVTYWADSSGTGNHLTSSIDSAPTMATESLNGHKAVLFNNGALDAGYPVLSGSSHSTTFVVCSPNSTTLNMLFEQEASNYSYENTSGRLGKFYIGNSGGATSSLSASLGAGNLLVMVASGSSMWTETNDVSGSAVPFTGNTGVTRFTLGGRFSAPHYYFQGKISEMIVYNRALNQTEINAVKYFLKNKYAL